VKKALHPAKSLRLEKMGQQHFSFIEADDFLTDEYAVLVTTLSDEVLTIAQRYRDRADCENLFDEIKKTMGLGRLCHPRDKTLSVCIPDDRLDLQGVEALCSLSRSG